jgi:hypothetical protein
MHADCESVDPPGTAMDDTQQTTRNVQRRHTTRAAAGTRIVSVPSLEESHRQLGLGDALEKWVKGILLDHAAVDSTALTSAAAAAARACACACVCFGGLDACACSIHGHTGARPQAALPAKCLGTLATVAKRYSHGKHRRVDCSHGWP